MNEKDMKIWTRLYDAVDLLKAQKPWELLESYDFITVEHKNGKGAAYCRVLDETENAYAVNVYESSDALFDIIYGMENEEIPWHQESRYNNCLSVIYIDRTDLPSEDRKMIDLLGRKYRGRKTWPMFRSYEKGHVIMPLNVREAARLADVLEQMIPTITDIRVKNLMADLDGEKTILRRFNKKAKSWETLVGTLDNVPKQVERFTVTDEIMMGQLKKRKKLKTVVEIDVMHHIFSYENDFDGKPRLERILLACEVGKPSEPFITSPLYPQDKEIEMILDVLLGYVEEVGRPAEIRLRDDMIQWAIIEICDELGIKTTVSGDLPVIDSIFESITGLDMIEEIKF